MEKLIAFFEIPAANFERAIQFYETVLSTKLVVYDCEKEKMAFFADNAGAISWAEDFRPSGDGVLIHLVCESIENTLSLIETNNGKIIIPKTQIEAEDKGYFATFMDTEGNRLGLWSKK